MSRPQKSFLGSSTESACSHYWWVRADSVPPGPKNNFSGHDFLSDPGVPGVRSMGPVVTMCVRDHVADLTDVTLVDGDTKPILTDNANSTIQGNVAMDVTHPGNLVVKF